MGTIYKSFVFAANLPETFNKRLFHILSRKGFAFSTLIMMQQEITNSDLLRYLRKKHVNTGFVNRLKIQYRPLVCPFIPLLKLVKDGDKVADIGCGSGQFCQLVSVFTKTSEIFGIEITQELVENARQLFAQESSIPHEFEQYDGMNFPPVIAKADIVFIIDVLHHVPVANQIQFLSNLCAVLKPGARLVIKDINAGSGLVYFNKLHDLIFAGSPGHELHPEIVMNELEQNQLTIHQYTKHRMYVYPHYTIVASKNKA